MMIEKSGFFFLAVVFSQHLAFDIIANNVYINFSINTLLIINIVVSLVARARVKFKRQSDAQRVNEN